MSKVRVHDEKPWEPTLDSLPVFNPFVNPTEHLNDPKPSVVVDEMELEATPAEELNRAAAEAEAAGDAGPAAALAVAKGGQ